MENPKDRLVYKENTHFRIKDVDVVNLKAFYTMFHEWFVEEEFCDDDADFPERYMRDRNHQKRGREMLIIWRFSKEPGGVKFYQRTYDVLIKIVGVKDIEVMQGGTKFKMQKGTIEIKVWGHLEYDAEGTWREHWLLKHVLPIYVYRLIKNEMEEQRNQLIEETQTIQNIIKDYLNFLKYDDKSPNAQQVAGVSGQY